VRVQEAHDTIVVLAGVGFLLAIISGFGRLMAQFGFLSNISFTPSTGLATVLAAAAIGAAASSFPAVQAARLAIVDALRRQE